MPGITKRLRTYVLPALLAAGLTLPSAALAEYPERPITLLIAWAAGGGTDTVARMFAAELEQQLGQPVNVVNQTGGGGVVGHQAMVSAAPDGYTLGIATMEVTVFESMGLAEFGPDDFTPIARIAEIPSGITVAAGAPYQSATELMDAIKAAPKGQFKASGCGIGCAWQFAVAGWLKSADLPGDHILWIPSQGGAPALQDLSAGGLDIVTASVVEARSLIDSGLVRPLAVMAPERQAAFPNLPTLKEASNANWIMSTWFGFVAPAGLPNDITEKLLAAAQAAHTSEKFRAFMNERGYVPVWQPRSEFAQFMTDQVGLLTPLVEELNLRN